jgi:hypothetical protein
MKEASPTLRTFRCTEYAATLTPLSCASRHVAASRSYRAGTESPWHLTACKTCRIGKAHAADQSASPPRASNVRGIVYTERALTTPELVQLRTKRPRARAEQRHGFTFRDEEAVQDAPHGADSGVRFAPIAAGAPLPDLEAQKRDAARAAERDRERRREAERRRRAEERARKERDENAIDWARVTSHVEAWLDENPDLTRRELHERAVAELGVTVSRGRFSVQLANRIDKVRDVATGVSDEAVREHMRRFVAEDARRGWRWHAESLRAAGMVVSADRVRRVLKVLREELNGVVGDAVSEKGRAA